MNVKELMERYPGTVVERTPFRPVEHMLYFYQDPYYIGIPSSKLSDQERQLLKIVLREEIPPRFSRKSEFWFNILVKGKPAEKESSKSKIRIIQFEMADALSGSDLIEWRSALEAFFEKTVSFIYLSSRDGLVIEEEKLIEEEMLRAIANTLENDFSVKTYFQMGLRYPLSSLIRKAYMEEGRLFRQHLSHEGAQEVTSVEHRFFLLLRPLVGEWAILGEVRSMIAKDKSWVLIIRAIWENQGNISMAAKQLFMHRNTLQNRIDKFFEMTGISLKRMDGLTIAYLSML